MWCFHIYRLISLSSAKLEPVKQLHFTLFLPFLYLKRSHNSNKSNYNNNIFILIKVQFFLNLCLKVLPLGEQDTVSNKI